MTTYGTIINQHGAGNVRQLGAHVIAVDRYGVVHGYDIATYNRYAPADLINHVYTTRDNAPTYDAAYDFFYGAPTTAPAFGANLLNDKAAL